MKPQSERSTETRKHLTQGLLGETGKCLTDHIPSYYFFHSITISSLNLLCHLSSPSLAIFNHSNHEVDQEIQKDWESISYCSDSCRKHKIKPHSLDTAFESKIMTLLRQRRLTQGVGAIVTCEEAESEVLKELEVSKLSKQTQPPLSTTTFFNEATNVNEVEGVMGEAGTREPRDPSRTRERCRQAARRLAARGEVLITQEGKVVDPSFAKGVMELKLPT